MQAIHLHSILPGLALFLNLDSIFFPLVEAKFCAPAALHLSAHKSEKSKACKCTRDFLFFLGKKKKESTADVRSGLCALPDLLCSSVRNISVQVSRAWCICACGPLSQEFGGLYCPLGGAVKTRGGPGRPRLTAQHVWSAGDQGAILGSELYRFR